MAQAWMVRSGKGGIRIEEFLAKRVVAIGWSELHADLSRRSYEDILQLVQAAYPSYHPSAASNAAAMLHKFAAVLAAGDRVVTYDSERRIYHLGTVAGPYQYRPDHVPGLPHVRSVTWNREVGRDSLTQATRNSLGSTLTLFRISDTAKADLEREHQEPARTTEPRADEDDAEDETVDDTAERSLELIKDMILGLDADKMEELLASVLRAMGYKARVTPKGPDRGVDVLASPDGLLLESPRIKGEVKHRPRTQMGAQDIRNFIGALRPGDSGIYLSTGGFTKEARYEAERANVPVSLVALDDLVELITANYAKFDDLGRVLVPLVPVWWPAKVTTE